MGVFANENKLGSKFWPFWKTVDSNSAEPKLLLVATSRERSSPSDKWLITSWSTKMGATPVYAWQFETCLTTMIDSASMWTGMGKLTRIPGAKTIVEVETGTNVRICYFWWKRCTWWGHDPKPQVRIKLSPRLYLCGLPYPKLFITCPPWQRWRTCGCLTDNAHVL